MKRFLLMLGALAIMAGSAFANDCNCEKCRAARQPSAGARGGFLGTGLFAGGSGARRAYVPSQYMGPPMQQMPAVAYPYYTTRGPRDFLAKDPRGIGP